MCLSRSEDKIGQVKFANCQQFCAVFPEYQYVFVGDSGQADALTAQLLTNGQMAEGISRPLTTFIHDLRESSDDLRAVSPAFRRLSPDDLVGDPPVARPRRHRVQELHPRRDHRILAEGHAQQSDRR